MKNEFQTVSTGVLTAKETDTVSANTFYGVMSAVLFYGLFGTAILAYFTMQSGFIQTSGFSWAWD